MSKKLGRIIVSFVVLYSIFILGQVNNVAAAQVFIKPANGTYTSPYGMRDGVMHYGIDIAASGSSVAVNASATGVISKVADGCSNNGYRGNTCNGGYGNYIIVRHSIAGQTYNTLYAHLKSINVNVGQSVSQGTQIGVMGNSGDSSAQHLHFEIYERDRTAQSQAVDPMPYLNGTKPTISYHTYDGTWATITITSTANVFQYVGYGIIDQLPAGGKYKVYGQREYSADGVLFYNVGSGYVHHAYGTIANHHATVSSTISTYNAPNGSFNRSLAPGTYKVHAAKDGWYNLGTDTWVNANQVLVTKN
ncbi:MAG: M23 family metallopeptidase [Solibacillus sp.]|uniref:M23 family metallopeptidase n=1 Tax=unclassified Solibacillus TaxID=2637870 RepID=UPI0030FCF1D1